MNYIESHTDVTPDGITDIMAKIFIDSQAVLRLSDCIYNEGTYTLQFWIKSANATQIPLEAKGLHRVINCTREWTKCEYTFTVNDTSDSAISFSFPVGIYYLYHVKLELGDMASDWTPNPSDAVRLMSVEADTESLLYRLSDKYCDKLGCDNGFWYIERNTELLTLDGTESGWASTGNNTYRLTLPIRGETGRSLVSLCDKFTFSSRSVSALLENEFRVSNSGNVTYIHIRPADSIASTLSAFKTWLSTNPVKVLIPAETTTVPLANYLQSMLSNLSAKGDLTISIDDDNLNSMSGFIEIKPIVMGNVNADMSVTVNNMSDGDIGFIYQIHCKGEVTNPAIYHSETNQHIKINGRFKLDDVITIDTHRGNKSITKTYYGVDENIINNLDHTSKWIQLQSGYNRIIQSADSGVTDMESVIIYTKEYQGV